MISQQQPWYPTRADLVKTFLLKYVMNILARNVDAVLTFQCMLSVIDCKPMVALNNVQRCTYYFIIHCLLQPTPKLQTVACGTNVARF